jgi:hypothetical protein
VIYTSQSSSNFDTLMSSNRGLASKVLAVGRLV